MNAQRVAASTLLVLAVGALLGSPIPLSGGTWYLNAGQTSDVDWDVVSFWSAAPDGSGGNPPSIAKDDIFDSNGKILRTPASESYFGGASLVLNGSRLLLVHDADISGTLTSAEVGSAVALASLKSRTLAVGILLPVGKGIGFWTDKAVATLTVHVETLTGNAPVIFGAPGKPTTLVFTATEASGFTGDLHITGDGTRVSFGNALNSAGGLVLDAGASITLDQNLSFNAVSIDGVDLPAGIHSFARLNATHDAFFNEDGTGSITVKGKRPVQPASSSQ